MTSFYKKDLCKKKKKKAELSQARPTGVDRQRREGRREGDDARLEGDFMQLSSVDNH